jgi:hypothetical protein
MAVGRGDIVFRLSLLKIASGVIAFLVSAQWGVLGVSIAFAVREWLVLPVEMALCQRYCPIMVRPVWKGIGRRLLTLIPMSLLAMAIQYSGFYPQTWLNLGTAVFCSAILYLLTLLIAERDLVIKLGHIANIPGFGQS